MLEEKPLKKRPYFPEKKKSYVFFHQKTKARFDRLWLNYPKSFDPYKGHYVDFSHEQALNLLEAHMSLEGKRVLDLACGQGRFSLALAKKGAKVDAVDVSSNALSYVAKHPNIHTIQDCLPETGLSDKKYDVVCFLDAIAYFPINQQRLVISEIQRVLKTDGFVLMSACLDLQSINAKAQFCGLFQTEFSLVDEQDAFHHFFIYGRNLLKKTELLSFACKSPRQKRELIEKAAFFYRMLLKILGHRRLEPYLHPLANLAHHLRIKLENSSKWIAQLEGYSRRLFAKDRPSSIICLGQKKPLDFL